MAIAPALKFTKEILGQVSRSDGGVKNYPQNSASSSAFPRENNLSYCSYVPKKMRFPRENNFQFSTILRLSA